MEVDGEVDNHLREGNSIHWKLCKWTISSSPIVRSWRSGGIEMKKGNSRRPTRFPKLVEYIRHKLLELDVMQERGESLTHLPRIITNVRSLIHDPLLVMKTRSTMWSKGRHFWIAWVDENKIVTADCDVMGQFTYDSWSNAHDTNLMQGFKYHYGKIEENMTVKWDFHNMFEEVLFECKWFKVNLKGVHATCKLEKCGFAWLKITLTTIVFTE